MGTRFVSVPDWETAAALISEGLLWFRKFNGTIIPLPQDTRSPTNPQHWCSHMDWYVIRIED